MPPMNTPSVKLYFPAVDRYSFALTEYLLPNDGVRIVIPRQLVQKKRRLTWSRKNRIASISSIICGRVFWKDDLILHQLECPGVFSTLEQARASGPNKSPESSRMPTLLGQI